ncbi:MAG: RNA polymerase sigma factor [Eubacterium sp.]
MVERKDYEKVFIDNFDSLYRTILSYCKNRDSSEDIIQNTFLKLYDTKNVFIDEKHLKNWIYKVAINEAKNTIKGRWFNYVLFDEKYIDSTIVDEEYSTLYECILNLKEKYRIVILLYYYEGYSIKEISQILEAKESTIQTRLSRARSRIKVLMENEDGK